MNEGHIVLRRELCSRLQMDAETKTVIYIGAHTGWGKTTAVKQYLEQNELTHDYLSTREADWWEAFCSDVEQGVPHIVVDDLHTLTNAERDSLSRQMAAAPFGIRFYLIGRAAMPPFLKPFYATNQLACYGLDELRLTEQELTEFFLLRGISCNSGLTKSILDYVQGWLLGAFFLAQRVCRIKGLTREAIELAELDVYDYFDNILWSGLSSQVQKVLLQIGHLEEFTERQVCMICGKGNMNGILETMLSMGSFLRRDSEKNYHFYHIFSTYLVYKRSRLCDEAFLQRNYTSTALYYAMENDLPNALRYYHMAGDQQRVTEILIENAGGNAGDAYFYELEKYYLELDEQEVLHSPEMICALAFLHSVSLRTAESDAWMEKLAALERALPDNDPRKKIAAEKLSYLSIAIPHRGIEKMLDKLERIAARRQSIQQVSISGNTPGVMNGSMDFCDWSRRDRFLYETATPLLNTVFGSYAAGLPEIALGESLFEKNADGNFTESLMLLNRGKAECQKCRNLQLEFAANALMARMFLCQGSSSTAQEMMEQFRMEVQNQGKSQLLLNVDAFLVRLSLLNNDNDASELWFAEQAPNEQEHFYSLERYRYLTKVLVYLVKGMHLEALSLLDQVEYYFAGYQRHYNWIEARLLRTIVLYRMGQPGWREVLSDALKICEDYGFYRVVSDLGAAIYEPLQKAKPDVGGAYHRRLLAAVQKQAICYPRYLAPAHQLSADLSEAEKNVLRLLVNGLSNAEIGRLLNISLATVKTHTGNIYAKMNVKNRLAAVKAAQEMKVI